jgi:fluoride exporter
MNFLLVGLGAAIGAMARYGLTKAIPNGSFPWVTAIINLSGSLLLGVVAAIWAKDHPVRLLLGVGLLGGYTTYSTYSLEVFEQLKRGEATQAIANMVLQACGSVVCCGVGYLIAQKFTAKT